MWTLERPDLDFEQKNSSRVLGQLRTGFGGIVALMPATVRDEKTLAATCFDQVTSGSPIDLSIYGPRALPTAPCC